MQNQIASEGFNGDGIYEMDGIADLMTVTLRAANANFDEGDIDVFRTPDPDEVPMMTIRAKALPRFTVLRVGDLPEPTAA